MRIVLDKIENVLKKHIIESTDFMNPYERSLARSLLEQFTDISYKEIGGLSNSERKIIIIYPYYYRYEDVNIPIEPLMVEGFLKNLSHRDFLGAILNLGIKREKIGDILIHQRDTQLVVKKEIASFILMHLERVNSEKIKIKEIQLKDLYPSKIDYKEKIITVASLRLDVLLSAALNVGRKESKKIIESRKVKVNWEPIDKVSLEVGKADTISIKGHGRFILYSIEGITRKDKIRIKLRLLK